MVDRAAVYARISSDPTGTSLGVTRQLQDCRALAAARGWVIAEEYVDNDVSAYSGQTRPAYERMVEDLRAGLRDAVIVYNLDRLTRRPIELEAFAATCTAAGVRDVASVTADVDLGTDDGLLIARVMAAFAAKESGAKSRRARRKMDELAQAGKPHGNGRTFGYLDHEQVIEAEADMVREAVSRFLSGDSLNGITRWANESGMRPVRASKWSSSTIRSLIASAKIAGLRSHHGEVVATGTWPAIITAEQHEQVLARLGANVNLNRRTPRRYLLSGLLTCGRCGAVLGSAERTERGGQRRRRYQCAKRPDGTGCNGLSIAADPLEAWITEAVLMRLGSPAVAEAIAAAAGPELATTLGEVETGAAQLEELAAAYADRKITMPEWLAARTRVEKRVDQARARLATLGDNATAAHYLTSGDDLREDFADLGLARQHALIRSMVAVLVIRPARKATFDPTDAVAWRP